MPEFNFDVKTYRRNVRRQRIIKAEQEDRRLRNMVMPTLFYKHIECVKEDTIIKVYDKYTIAENTYKYKSYFMTTRELIEQLSYCASYAIRLFYYITINLEFNSNVVKIEYSDCKKFGVGKYNDDINSAINVLLNKHIIFKTDIKSIYLINHNMYFYGDYDKFIRIYKELYADLPVSSYYNEEENKLYIKNIVRV